MIAYNAASTLMRLRFPYMLHVSLFKQSRINVYTASTLICHLTLGSFRVGSKHFHVKSFAARSYENHPKCMLRIKISSEYRDQTVLMYLSDQGQNT